MISKNTLFAAVTLTMSSFGSIAESNNLLTPINVTSKNELALEVSQNKKLASNTVDFKQELINKLSHIEQFSAAFEQTITDNQGNVLQSGGGDLSVKRPNLVHWNTTSPDESLIVSDGDSIFLFDPFIEQVTAYNLDGAIANTPILLITSNDIASWQNYTVNRLSEQHYVIHAKDQSSRISTLEISFNDKSELSGFTFLDVTGQLSKILLKNINLSPSFASSLFHFSIPEGIHLDDQR